MDIRFLLIVFIFFSGFGETMGKERQASCLLSFTSSVVYGSQKNDLSVYVSNNFNAGTDMAAINAADWTEITERLVLAEAEKFVPSGSVDISGLVQRGKALFIAFRYGAPATKSMTQRMWRIHGLTLTYNRKRLDLSDWLLINHTGNEENVGWEVTSKGITYRSRMTRKRVESWAIVQVRLPAGSAQQSASAGAAEQVGRAVLQSAMQKAYLSAGPGAEVARNLGNTIEVLEKVRKRHYERWHIKYKVDNEEYSYAYLLIPDTALNGGKLPLVLCPHPTYIYGKNRVVHQYDSPPENRNDSLKRESGKYGVDLVERGYVVFAPDRAGYGERAPLPGKSFKENMAAYSKQMREKYPGFGLNGKAIWDLQRALDQLLDFEFIDRENIGIIGHSLGAWDAILFSALDERVRATVVNSGGMVAYVPELWEDPVALTSYLETPSQQSLTKNVNVFLMLNSDRSVFYLFSLRDPFYKGKPQLIEGYPAIYQYFKTHNSKKRADISYFLHSDGHTFYPTQKLAAYSWLDERLMQNN